MYGVCISSANLFLQVKSGGWLLVGLTFCLCFKASLMTTCMGNQLFTWLLLLMSLVVTKFVLSSWVVSGIIIETNSNSVWHFLSHSELKSNV